MLGITSDLPDHEPLLQKHFFSVLSVAWRNISHSSHSGNALLFQNRFYSSQEFYASASSKNSLGKSSDRLGFSNLPQCGKLVAAALNRSRNIPDDRPPVINPLEDTPIEKEILHLTLELETDRDEVLPLPSVVNVSILGADPSTSLKGHAGEDRQFKSSRGTVESQFRYYLLLIQYLYF